MQAKNFESYALCENGLTFSYTQNRLFTHLFYLDVQQNVNGEVHEKQLSVNCLK